MSYTDHYELFKSSQSDPLQGASPFTDSQWNYLSDINNSVYSQNGLSLVQFDMSSIFNSTKLISPDSMFLTIPITYVTAFASTAAVLAPPQGAMFSTGLKSGYWNLVNAGDINLNGQQLEQYQPNLNNYVNFKMLSSMNADDLAQLGPTLGMGQYGVDNWQSQVYNAGSNFAATGTFPNATVTAGVSGNGMSNNKPFALATQLVTSQTTTAAGYADIATVTLSASNAAIAVNQLVTGAGIPANTYVVSISATTLILSQKVTIGAAAITLYFYNAASANSNGGEQSQLGGSGSGTYNKNYYSRLTKFADLTTSATSNFYGSDTTKNITSLQNLQKEFRPIFQVTNASNLCVWQDVAIIRLGDIFNSIKSLPLSKRLDMTLRLYFNVGTVVSNVTATGGLMLHSSLSNTFTNTCPLIQSCLDVLPTGCVNIASALYIATPGSGSVVNINTTNNAVNFSSGVPSHYMNQCRLYYKQSTLRPEILSNYISSNRSKQINYTTILTNTFNVISAGSTFSFLVQSGVTRIKSVIIFPYISGSVNGANPAVAISGLSPFAQQLSPLDSAPSTGAPISLISLNIAVGGLNVLQNNQLAYSYESFIEQVSLYANTSGSDLGLSVGLYNQDWWTANRTYFIDCSRCARSDYETTRNITITGVNNSNVTIDLLVITEYEKVGVLDVETGLFNL